MPRVPRRRKSRNAPTGPYEVSETMVESQPTEVAMESDVDKVNAMAEQIASKKLSKKAKRKLESARKKEEAEAKLIKEESSLPPEEQTKRQLRRKHLAEYRDVKSQIAALKKKRIRLGRRTLNEREARKKISKSIKEMMANLKARHTAEWKLAGFDQTEADEAMYDEKEDENME